MDTLALNLNLGTVAAAATGAEGAPPESAESTDTLDFAQLLAAGLDSAQAPTHPVTVAPAQSDTSSLPELDSTPEPPPDALATSAQNMPQLALPALATFPTLPPQARGQTSEPQGTDVRNAVGRLAGLQGQATSIAAEAAILAAASTASEDKTAAAELDQLHAETVFNAEIAKRESEQVLTTHASRGAEATAAGIPLAPSVERPVAPQATALLDVGAPVSGPGFADALSRQVVWMVDKDAQVAELRVNPPELGPVEVRLTLSGDEASAQFVSGQAEVRNAIEASLGRLREAMAQAGIQLGEATVSAESFRDQSAARDGQRGSRHGYRIDAAESAPPWPAGSMRTGTPRGLIDVFA